MICNGCGANIFKPMDVKLQQGSFFVECPNCGYNLDIEDTLKDFIISIINRGIYDKSIYSKEIK